MRDVIVLGIGTSEFGKFPHRTVSDLGGEAVRAALADAGIEAHDLPIAYVSRLYSEMINGQRILGDLGIAGIEIVNVENACAGGSTAVHEVFKLIASGYAEVGLALGVESMTTSPVAGKLIPPAEDDLDGQLGMAMPVTFALQARRLMETHGATEDDFARISVKAHTAGALNPRAQYRKRFTVEDVLSSRLIADPIRLLECCPNTDGAAAVVLASPEFADRYAAASLPRVRIAASALRSGDFSYQRSDLTTFNLGASAAAAAYESAGIDPSDIDVVELHDAFASEEIVHYEDLQLCKRGAGVGLLRDGATSLGGRVPVNPSGGLLSLGHPLSASGVRVVADITAQLRGTAGAVQVVGSRVGVAQMLGGAASGLETGACTVQVLTT